MCLAIFKPANVILPTASLRNGWIANPDGGGYAFAHKGKLTMRKGFMTLKDFLAAYEKDAKKYYNDPWAVHFRIRSLGDKSADNTHPFEIKDGVLIHNGTLDGTDATYSGASDTRKFVDMFSDKLTYNFCLKHKEELNDGFGWNKMVMLYKDGKHVIINEGAGHWEEGVWYSNYTHREKPASTVGNGAHWNHMYD